MLEDFHTKHDFFIREENIKSQDIPSETLVMLTLKSELKPELRHDKTRINIGQSDEDFRLSITNIQPLENVMKAKTRQITVTLFNGYLSDDSIIDLERLINQNRSPNGVGLRFRIFNLDQSMNIYLTSNEKVDVVPFCRELRKVLRDDNLIRLE
jgi:hypothetical protein